jgi:hypothetical protein
MNLLAIVLYSLQAITFALMVVFSARSGNSQAATGWLAALVMSITLLDKNGGVL